MMENVERFGILRIIEHLLFSLINKNGKDLSPAVSLNIYGVIIVVVTGSFTLKELETLFLLAL